MERKAEIYRSSMEIKTTRSLLRKGKKPMSNVTREHKNNVFCLLYREKKNLLSLYNSLNGTFYEKEEELDVVTLEGAICMKVKNDAAFVLDARLNLYEQQSTVNPNMPLRDLYYIVEELKKTAPSGCLYRTTKVRIPAPRFVVFYNGVEKQPERQVYKLSDLYIREEEEPEMELKVTVLNINEGCNTELLKSCESLRGYMTFVGKVREKRRTDMTVERAVQEAVEECISENVLADFFREHKEEILEMSIFEFDQELYDKTIREEAWDEGREEGREEGLDLSAQILREIRRGNQDDDAIALLYGCSAEKVKRIRSILAGE